MSSALLANPAERMRLAGVSTEVLHVDTIDDRDRALIEAHTTGYWLDPDPRPVVGDIVRLDSAGIRTVRIAYLWPDAQYQPTLGTGSFHLMPGFLRHSGALDGVRRLGHLVALPTPEWARCWIFHHDIRRAHHAIDVEIPRRVWVHDPTYLP